MRAQAYRTPAHSGSELDRADTWPFNLEIDSAPPRLMTAQEVAEMLRVPRSTVYELARNRRIPFLKVGRRTLFAQQSILDWIAARTVQPRS